MNKTKYNFVYNIGDRVRIRDLDIKGRVSGIYITKEEITYNIRYFHNNEPKNIYFNSSELELIPSEEVPLGFNKRLND
jgi:hypothetical protein